MVRMGTCAVLLVLVFLGAGMVSGLEQNAKASIVPSVHNNVSTGSTGPTRPPASGPLVRTTMGSQPFVGAPVAPYDEQLFTSFAESQGSASYAATNLTYSVVAVAQGGQYGYGPTYFLNGKTDADGWYQLGLAYNWTYSGGGYNPGFYALYEVWNSAGQSIYPSGCGFCSGYLSFSTSVQPGDRVFLNLHFSAGNVIMTATDMNTGGSASTSYSAQSGTQFIGNANYPFDNYGYITGLMTEQYFVNAYYGTEQPVAYTNAGSPTLGASWLWLDEYTPSNNLNLWTCYTINSCLPNPYYSLASALQTKTYDGGVISTNSTTFITGSKPLTTPAPYPPTWTMETGQSLGMAVTMTVGHAVNATAPVTYKWLETTPSSAGYVDATDCGSGNPASSTPLPCTFTTTDLTSPGTYKFAVRVWDTANASQEAAVLISSPSTVTVVNSSAVGGRVLPVDKLVLLSPFFAGAFIFIASIAMVYLTRASESPRCCYEAIEANPP